MKNEQNQQTNNSAKGKRTWQWIGLIAACIIVIAVGFFILTKMANSGKPADAEAETTEAVNAAETTAPVKATEETAAPSNAVTEPDELPPEIGELTFPPMPEGIILPEDTFAP